jgi:ADP-ribose pyrophosphatase YjhB (NUDIX family)
MDRINFCPRCGVRVELRQAFGRERPVCPQCGYVHFHDPKVAVGVVVEQDGKLLLTKRNHEPKMGEWSFPSGYVESGEKLEDAAVRETKEETGLDIQIDALLGVYSETGSRVVFVAYAGLVTGGEPQPGDEAEAVAFFLPEELPPPAFPHDPDIIRRWHIYRKARQRTEAQRKLLARRFEQPAP